MIIWCLIFLSKQTYKHTVYLTRIPTNSNTIPKKILGTDVFVAHNFWCVHFGLVVFLSSLPSVLLWSIFRPWEVNEVRGKSGPIWHSPLSLGLYYFGVLSAPSCLWGEHWGSWNVFFGLGLWRLAIKYLDIGLQ